MTQQIDQIVREAVRQVEIPIPVSLERRLSENLYFPIHSGDSLVGCFLFLLWGDKAVVTNVYLMREHASARSGVRAAMDSIPKLVSYLETRDVTRIDTYTEASYARMFENRGIFQVRGPIHGYFSETTTTWKKISSRKN